MKIEKSKIQGKTREKVKKVKIFKFLLGSILALFSWSDPHDPKLGPHPPRQVGPTPGQFGPKSPVSASKSPPHPSSPTFGSANLAQFRPKRPFSLFSHKPMGGRLASPPPAKRSGWDTQNVEKIRPRPTDPKPVLGQSGAKTNVLEAAEGPSARPAAHTHIWADRTSPKHMKTREKWISGVTFSPVTRCRGLYAPSRCL